MVDNKILRLLKNDTLTEEEKQQCRQHGVFWECSPMTHDEMIGNIKSAAEKITLKRAAAGFLYSISTGDYRYRTALSSLIWAKSLPDHPFTPWNRWNGTDTCEICGVKISAQTNRAVLNETRMHRIRLIPQKNFIDICNAEYVLCDLQYFADLPEVQYCDEDFRILNRIFGLVQELTENNKVNALLHLISAESTISLKTADAFSVLGVLSSCGVFDTPHCKSYRSGFVNCADRGFMYETDIYYPLIHWKGRYRVNYAAIADVFGEKIAQRLSPETAICGEANRNKSQKNTTSIAKAFFTDGIYTITLDNHYRHYYGLQPLQPAWDKVVMYSSTYSCMKRTVLFYEGDVIKKFIYEEKYSNSKNQYYLECDTDAETQHRELLLPKTSKGRPKPITPSLLNTAVYMKGHLRVVLSADGTGGIAANNYSNEQTLPLPPAKIASDRDFVAYTERYIASCPDGYEALLEHFRSGGKRNVRFSAGDIFRVQLTPTLYTYCLILGKMRKILKWTEITPEHPMQHISIQSFAFRQYAIVTEQPDMTTEELRKISLLPVRFARERELAGGTYQIVCAKPLEESDIDLGFVVNTRQKSVAWNLAVHDFGEAFDELFPPETGIQPLRYEDRNRICVDDHQMTAGIIPVKEDNALKERLIAYLELDPQTAVDDFAVRFGGISRKQLLARLKK